MLVTALTIVFVSLFISPSAQAHGQEHWAAGTTVCVDLPSDYATMRWNIRTELYRWNALPGGPRLVARKWCPYNNSIHIRVKRSHNAWQGYTWASGYSSGEIVHVDIELNPTSVRSARYSRGDRPCLRSWAMGHELGHSLGAPHYPNSHYGSIMSYMGWKGMCGKLASGDRYSFSRIYG